jgi:hypothetical protein
MDALCEKLNRLKKSLQEMEFALSKGMNNSGLGGVGSVKDGAVLPNTSILPKKGNNSLSSKIKMPSVAPASKKNPIKSIEQIQNKDMKDTKMKEAKSNMPDIVKTLPNGQWTLEKSSYPGVYDDNDNARRKSKNTPDESPIGTMKRVKKWPSAGRLDREVKEIKQKNKKQPVKTYTKEEIEGLKGA